MSAGSSRGANFGCTNICSFRSRHRRRTSAELVDVLLRKKGDYSNEQFLVLFSIAKTFLITSFEHQCHVINSAAICFNVFFERVTKELTTLAPSAMNFQVATRVSVVAKIFPHERISERLVNRSWTAVPQDVSRFSKRPRFFKYLCSQFSWPRDVERFGSIHV